MYVSPAAAVLTLTSLRPAGGHSNTERGFLPVLAPKFAAALLEDVPHDLEVVVSQADRDPLRTV